MQPTLTFVLLGLIGIPELMIIGIIALLFSLVPMIFYLLTLQNTLYAVSPANREMPAPQVWLMLIPIFNLVWQFIMVNKITESLQTEFKEREIPSNEPFPGRTIGIAYCILFCCTIIPFLGTIAGLAGLVCWIIFWVKMSECKMKLMR